MGIDITTGKNDNELRGKQQLISTFLDELYEEIKHGDEEHQRWLKSKIEEFKNRKLSQLNKNG